MSFYVYPLSPIDHNWDMLRTVQETAVILSKAANDGWTEAWEDRLTVFLSRWKFAQENARSNGWEGDFRGEPRVIWLPDPEAADFVPAFVFKQDNNGTTFVVSPIQITHLGDAEFTNA